MNAPQTHIENSKNEGLSIKSVPRSRWELSDHTIILHVYIFFLFRSYDKTEESIEELTRGLHSVKGS